jgi:hypothetical protein
VLARRRHRPDPGTKRQRYLEENATAAAVDQRADLASSDALFPIGSAARAIPPTASKLLDGKLPKAFCRACTTPGWPRLRENRPQKLNVRFTREPRPEDRRRVEPVPPFGAT